MVGIVLVGSGVGDGGSLVGGGVVGGCVVGGRVVGGCVVGGTTVGGRVVGGRVVGGTTVGGRVVGGTTVGGRVVGGTTVGGRDVGRLLGTVVVGPDVGSDVVGPDDGGRVVGAIDGSPSVGSGEMVGTVTTTVGVVDTVGGVVTGTEPGARLDAGPLVGTEVGPPDTVAPGLRGDACDGPWATLVGSYGFTALMMVVVASATLATIAYPARCVDLLATAFTPFDHRRPTARHESRTDQDLVRPVPASSYETVSGTPVTLGGDTTRHRHLVTALDVGGQASRQRSSHQHSNAKPPEP